MRKQLEEKETVMTDVNAQKRNYSNPRYNCKNLKFLIDFLKATQMTVNEFAGSYSHTVVLRRQLNNDDMPLSRAKTLFANKGYTLGVRYVDSYETDDKVSIILEIPKNHDKKRSENFDIIRKLLEQRNISMAELAERIEVSQGAIQAWKRVDDFRISYLYRISKELDAKLEFKVSVQSSKTQEDGQTGE